MASSSPSLNLHFSPEWMRTGQSTGTNSKHPSSTNPGHPPVNTPGLGSGAMPATNGTSASTAASTGSPSIPNSVNGVASANGLSTNHTQPATSTPIGGLMTPAPTGMGSVTALNVAPLSAYSSLLTPAATAQGARLSPNTTKDPSADIHDPFRYGKDDILSIWRAGLSTSGGSGWSLGIEVERHDGVVIDLERTPSCARDMTEAEVKLYSAPSLNSRRPSVSHTHSHNAGRSSIGERDGEPVGLGILGRRGTGGEGSSMVLPPGAMRTGSLGGGPTSPLRERFPRRDSTGVNQPYRPRQLSSAAATPLADGAPPLISPRTTSSGFGFGGGPGFDGVLGAGEGWGGRKRGALANAGRQGSHLKEIQEKAGSREAEDESKDQAPRNVDIEGSHGSVNIGQTVTGVETLTEEPAFENWEDDPDIATDGTNIATDENQEIGVAVNGGAADELKKRTPNPSEIKWQYLDDQQVKQGPFTPEQLTTWDGSGWLRPDLRMNRPDYDSKLLPLAEWKSMLHSLGITDDKQVFHTWFEPVRDTPPVKTLEPPPGLAMPQQPQSNLEMERKESPPQAPASEGTATSTETPSVFDALRKTEVASASAFHGAKGTHTPSSIFGGSAGDAVFSHSPISGHRLPIRPGTIDTGSSSPASVHAESAFGHSGLSAIGNSRLQQINALHSQVPSGGSGIFNSLNYSPHNPLPPSLTRATSQGVPSPLAGYAGITSPYAGVVDSPSIPSPYSVSQTGSIYGGSAFRQGSFDQQASVGAPWQGNRNNLAPGSGHPARTGSSASSQSNNPRPNFGGRRSASPAGIAGSLGGEVYDGLVGSAMNNAIGRGGVASAIPTNHSPQQLYGTLYRTPVQPIPEASPIQSEAPAPMRSLSYSLQQEIEPPRQPEPTNVSEIASNAAPKDVSNADPWSTAPPLIQPQPSSAWNLPTQPSEVQTSPDTSGNETRTLAAIVGQTAKGKSARKRDSGNEVTAAPKVAAAVNTVSTPEIEAEENGVPFVPVKKRVSTTHAPTTQPTVVSTNAILPTNTHAPSSTAASTKMTVPLASLITNPTPVTNQSPVTPVAPKAWATVAVKDEGKSLKEIQEAEERRVRESQKSRHPAVTPMASSASVSKDEEIATLTWGLPTSLAGARNNKEAASPSGTAPSPVWANAAKVVSGSGTKKAMTMKDIQEEEERRRQKEKEVVTAAKRIAEKKVAPPLAPSPVSTGVWATVGPGGKAARPSTGGSTASVTPTGIAALPPRPSAAAIASSGMRTPHTASATSTMNATPSAAPAARRPQTASAVVNSSAKSAAHADDPAHGVSTDTLKWMRDTLKGRLTKGITVDEVVGLVLMMQEEDDIADTIYQSSTTLPGKRFAAEFIERRNADKNSGNSTSFASARPAAVISTVNTETAAMPSVASQDTLGYKVVKKKGRGGKA